MYIDHTTWEKDVKLVLLQNYFPYFTQNNMEHYVLWELNGYITRDDILEKNRSAKNTTPIIDYIYRGDLPRKDP